MKVNNPYELVGKEVFDTNGNIPGLEEQTSWYQYTAII